MKTLDQYQTPETDEAEEAIPAEASDLHAYQKICEHARLLERRLAACREALAFYAAEKRYPAPFTGGLGDLYFDCGTIARKALTATATP